MLFLDIKNFKCSKCGNDEYSVIDLKNHICICSKCGKQVNENEEEYKIEIVEVEE